MGREAWEKEKEKEYWGGIVELYQPIHEGATAEVAPQNWKKDTPASNWSNRGGTQWKSARSWQN